MTMNEHMLSQPVWIVIWIAILVGIHIVAVPLAFKDWRPRVMVVVMLLNMVFMLSLIHI